MRTTQVFVASTLYGVMSVVAGIDAGQYDPDQSDRDDDVRRILVISNNAVLPEVTTPPDRMAGFDLLAKHFDRVVSYNEAIAPFHPSSWFPRPLDTPLWQRYLRRLWDLGNDDIHLIVESIQVSPARAICSIFTDAGIDVYADGLMSYGPTRSALDPLIGSRVERLLYADLVPGLSPLLLSEWPIRRQLVPTSAITRVIADIAAATDLAGVVSEPDDRPVALLLGQYLSALDIVNHTEEEALHLRMLDGAIARGHRRVIFKAHPSAPRELTDSLRAEAARQQVDFEVVTAPVLAETLYVRLPVAEVIGCFSTAMFTASSYFKIPVARVGTELMMERLTPYHNSNRVPVTITDALVPDLELPTAEATALARANANLINDLVGAVGYVMQPALQAERRAAAEAFLSEHYPQVARYFKRRRLTTLELPGALSRVERRRTVLRRARNLVGRMVRARSAAPVRELRRQLRRSSARPSHRQA